MLRAGVQLNSSSTLAYQPALLQERFGIQRRSNVGSCLIAQTAFTIHARTNGKLKAGAVSRHLLDRIHGIGLKGCTLEAVVNALQEPIKQRNRLHSIRPAVTRPRTPKQLVSDVIDGHPTMVILPREACNAIETEALMYNDGTALATVIRPAKDELYHSYLAFGIDAADGGYVLCRDTRDEYCFKGYLRIHHKLLRDAWKRIGAVSLHVLEHQVL